MAESTQRAVHGYRDVQLDIVWGIIERDLPELARCLRVELDLRREREGPTRGRDTGLDIGF
ncbi:MAG: HepT-like ribonuclease domain-containing protein [Acidimicrobiales bacterium]